MGQVSIMVVEDEPITAAQIDNLLKKFEYNVSAITSSGEAAIRHASELALDLVLMDIELEGDMDGVEAAAQIRTDFNIPVIYLTSHSDEEIIKRAKLTEPFGYLLKPIEPRALHTTIKMALYKHEIETKLKESELKFRSVIERSGDGICIFDERGLIAEWNLGMERLTGFKRDEMVGQEICEVSSRWLPEAGIGEAASDRFRKEIQQLLRNGHPEDGPAFSEYVIRRADGSFRTIQSSPFSIKTERGFMLCQISRDITDRQLQQEELERQVKLRTSDLEKANQILTNEIAERKQAEEEIRRLFEQVSAGRERLQALSQRLLSVQEAERRYIARELHDEIGQTLTSLKICLEMISPQNLISSERSNLAQAQDIVFQLLRRVRDLSLDLRPGMLDDLGLLPALLYLFERYTTQTNIKVNFVHSGINKRFDPEIETAAYRLVQEALTNVARHAAVDSVNVRLWADEVILGLQVEDEGAGFDLESTTSSKHTFGLSGMYERTVLIGGTLVIESVTKQGTRITAELPFSGHLERRTDERINSFSG